MAQGNKASVRMTFNDGTAFNEWLSIEWRDTWTDPLGDLKLVAAPSAKRIFEYRDKLQKGELVTMFVNDVNQGGFLIQTVETVIDPQSGVMFTITCHTPLITAYQGSVDPKLSFKSQTDAAIGQIVLKALGPYGFDTEIDGDSTANISALTGKPLPGGAQAFRVDALKQDQACAQEGETAYQFCARLLTRLGIALHVNFDGALLINSPDYGQEPSYTIVQSADPNVAGDRFFGPITIVDTNDNQFSECRVRGNPNDKAGTTQTSAPDVVVTSADLFPNRPPYKSKGAADAPSPAGYKPLIIKDKNARDIDRATSVAKLALGIRAKDAFVISGEVDGFVATSGAVWTTGTIANVRIDAVGFNEPMFVLERTLSQNRDGGQSCRLKLIAIGALVLGDVPSGG